MHCYRFASAFEVSGHHLYLTRLDLPLADAMSSNVEHKRLLEFSVGEQVFSPLGLSLYRIPSDAQHGSLLNQSFSLFPLFLVKMARVW